MAMADDKLLKLEELKEIGHDYRYRDQLMVQEFYFSVAVAGLVAGVVLHDVHTYFSIVVQVFGLLFLAIITLHLRNINEDRRLAGDRRNELLADFGFYQAHRGIAKARSFPVVSAPRSMVLFSMAATLGWAAWLLQNAVYLIFLPTT